MRLDIQLFADGKVVLETELDTSGVEEGLDDLPKKLKISDLVSKFKSKLTPMFRKIGDTFEKVGVKISEIAKKTLSFMGDVFRTITEIGIGLTGALAIVGIIGVLALAIQHAVENNSETMNQITTKVQYIIYVLKTSLQPIIEWLGKAILNIINKAVTGVLYIIALISALTGKKMPTAQEFADNMENAEKSSKGTAKNAKEIKKQLAGFDEMNVIQDNQGGGAGAGAGASQFDIPALNVDIENISQKVQDFVDKIRTAYKILVAENTAANRAMILNSDSTWGLLKLGCWDAIQGIILMFNGLVDVLFGIGKIIVGIFTLDWGLIKEGAVQLVKGIREEFAGIQQLFMGIGEIIAGVFIGTFNTIIKALTPFANTIINTFNTMVGKVNTAFTNLKNGINNVIGNIKTFLTNTFGSFGTAVGNLIGDRIKAVINGVLALAETMLNKPINAINSAITTLNKITGGKISKLSTLKFPRLAKGGIINMPGKGVAIGGEAGKEGVIPLTDSQQMELLGEAIGRYITINANITNTMNGRIISRELQKINNENSFAGNR